MKNKTIIITVSKGTLEALDLIKKECKLKSRGAVVDMYMLSFNPALKRGLINARGK
jgi:hypothetical protein